MADAPKKDPYSFDISDIIIASVTAAMLSEDMPAKTFWGRRASTLLNALGAVGGI